MCKKCADKYNHLSGEEAIKIAFGEACKEDKIMKEKLTIDIEPKWAELISILLNIKDKEIARKELMKIAVIADQIRYAQKNKEKLVFDFREVQE